MDSVRDKLIRKDVAHAPGLSIAGGYGLTAGAANLLTAQLIDECFTVHMVDR